MLFPVYVPGARASRAGPHRGYCSKASHQTAKKVADLICSHRMELCAEESSPYLPFTRKKTCLFACLVALPIYPPQRISSRIAASKREDAKPTRTRSNSSYILLRLGAALHETTPTTTNTHPLLTYVPHRKPWGLGCGQSSPVRSSRCLSRRRLLQQAVTTMDV
jgi:hypothetical protein